MGQQVTTECHCHDGLFQFCVPEDPTKEDQNTLQAGSPSPTYPLPTLSDQPNIILNMGSPSQNAAVNLFKQGLGFDITSEDRAFVSAPPPAGIEEHVNIGGIPPPSPSGGTPPPVSPARREVTPEDILSNLEGSEEVLYGDAFAMLPGGRTGFISLDCGVMRDFICTNSAITMQDIDLELLKVTSPDEGLTHSVFLHLLREFPISESDAISNFLGLSGDGESLVSEDCRTGLLLFAQQRFSASFSEDRWECILNTVMWDAGMMVTMEQWLSYCKLIGRIVRLFRFGQVQKLYGNNRRGKTGVRGGA